MKWLPAQTGRTPRARTRQLAGGLILLSCCMGFKNLISTGPVLKEVGDADATRSAAETQGCQALREEIALRTDRRLIRNGGAYSCEDCPGVLKAAQDERLHSCSQCGAIKPMRRRSATDQPVLDVSRLPDTSRLDWRVPKDQVSQWFLHQGNAQRLGHANLTHTLPSDSTAAFGGFVERRSWGRCAAVGSGGSLWQSASGRAIDAHDVVLRVNNAPCVGYEKHVGAKTDIRIFNTKWTNKYSTDKRNPNAAKNSGSLPLEEGVSAIMTRVEEADFARMHRLMQDGRPDVQLRLLSSRVVSSVRDHLLVPYRQKLNATCEEPLLWGVAEGRDTPTSGLVAVFLLMQLCEEVTVYGFSGSNDSNRYHYFKSNRNYMNRTHSFTVERALLRAMARDGLIRFEEGNMQYVIAGVRRQQRRRRR